VKLKYSRWRTKAYEYLKEVDEPLSAYQILQATHNKVSPPDSKVAAQILKRDDRFMWMMSDSMAHSQASASERRVLLFEVAE
jgi:hypothetical protein